MEGASSRGLSGSSSAYAPPGSADDRNRRCEHVVDLPTRGSDIQRATAGRKHAIFSNGGDAVHAARPKLSEDTKSNDRVKAYVRTRATQRFASHLISVSNGLGREQVSVRDCTGHDHPHVSYLSLGRIVVTGSRRLFPISRGPVWDRALIFPIISRPRIPVYRRPPQNGSTRFTQKKRDYSSNEAARSRFHRYCALTVTVTVANGIYGNFLSVRCKSNPE